MNRSGGKKGTFRNKFSSSRKTFSIKIKRIFHNEISPEVTVYVQIKFESSPSRNVKDNRSVDISRSNLNNSRAK